MIKCGDCRFWSETSKNVTTRSKQDNYKYCASGKMVYDIERGAGTPIDGIGYMDGECYGAALWTGIEFGCIHAELKE